jgi:HD-GYP domain-containing protein (c-di-GMP phosphodiesterase class II)
MNIAAMRMHADLEDQPQPLNWMQRDSIDQHPGDSLLMLQAGGLRDPDWLKAVAQHHENLDGTGYPKQLRGDEVVIAARILRLADFYVAKIRSRRYRPAETTRTAFRNIFGKERSRLDGKIALVLLRKLGLYPPGTLMRLANKEIAVVVRKQGNGESAGRVVVFLAPNGRLLKQPLERNTSQTDFAILNITEIESEWPDIRWPRFWGY